MGDWQSVGTQGQKGYRWHKGHWGFLEGVGGTGDVLGADRECRYSGARRGIGGIRAIGGS